VNPIPNDKQNDHEEDKVEETTAENDVDSGDEH